MKISSNQHKPTIALIGCGHFGTFHIQCLKRLSEICDFKGVYDENSQKTNNVSAEFGIYGFDSYEEFLNCGADCIDVVSSTNTHFKVANDCLKKNIHVFVEKPIASTIREAAELILFARNNKLVLQVGYIERYTPCLKKIVEFSSTSSNISIVRIAKPRPNFNDNIISDLMIHDLDILVNFCFPTVQPKIVSIKNDKNDIACSVEILFGDTKVNVKACKSDKLNTRTYNFSGKYDAIIDLQTNSIQLKNGTDSFTDKIQEVNKLELELTEFIDRTKNHEPTNYEQDLKSFALAELIKQNR
ncbi:MAG: Gfo/Idh/MocA family oxidoreductase [Planctomycetes bacterium]|nr:Gfo/Idh/MocA family oxidoreductase [Planctomycetota bacterium]